MSTINTWAPLSGDVGHWAAQQLSLFMGPAGRVIGVYRRSDGPHAVVYSLDGSCYAVPVNDAASTAVDHESRDIKRAAEAAIETRAGRLPPEWTAWRGEAQDLADLELAALLQSEGHLPLRQCADAFSYTKQREQIAGPPSDSERHAIESLKETGITDPTTALLRARLMLDHARNARDLGHGWPDMLGLKGEDLALLDMTEQVTQAAYQVLLDEARRGPDLPLLSDLAALLN